MAKHSRKKRRMLVAGSIQRIEAMENSSAKTCSLKVILQALVIVAAVLWIYWPVLHGDWLWDDDLLVTQNTVVKSPPGSGKFGLNRAA